MSSLTTTDLSSFVGTPVKNTIAFPDFFGFSPFYIFMILVLLVIILCVVTWVLLACHYRLKYQIATLKQFHSMDQATVLRQVTRQQSDPSSYFADGNTHHKPDSSLDVSHSYDYHKETTHDVSDDKLLSDSTNLTVNRLYNFSKGTQSPQHKNANLKQTHKQPTISELDIQSDPNQIVRSNHRSRPSNTNDGSLVSYIGLSRRPSRASHPMYSKHEFAETNQPIFPFLSKQQSASPTDKLLMSQIEHAYAKAQEYKEFEALPPVDLTSDLKVNQSETQVMKQKANNHLSIPNPSPTSWISKRRKSKSKSMSPNSEHSSTYSDTRSGHSLYHATRYNTKRKTIREGFAEQSKSSTSSIISPLGSFATSSPSSVFRKASSKRIREPRDDSQESNDYEVQLKIIDMNDKENCNTRNSLSLHRKIRCWNKNRRTQTDMDEFYIEPCRTPLSSQMVETSKSNETVLIHGDSSCLTNVLDEFNEESDGNKDVTEGKVVINAEPVYDNAVFVD